MTRISCRHFTSADASDYETLLKRCPGNLIYSSLPFLAFLTEVTGSRVALLLAIADGEIVGGLPYAVLDVPNAGRVINSLPWWGSHGSVALDRLRPDADDVRRALLEAFVETADDLNALSSTIILLPEEQASVDLYKSVLQPEVIDGRLGQITPFAAGLAATEADLERLFQQKTRNLVRKGMKQGFSEVVSDEAWAWDFLHHVHEANISALGGRAKPRRHFELIGEVIPADMRRLSIAMDGSEPVAAMLTLNFNGTVEYITPAVVVTQRSRQPLSFLIMHGMLDALRGGATSWNWGGTWLSQMSLHHFKAGFGAVDRPYTYLTRASREGKAFFRQHKNELGMLFPFFFTYPYQLLDDQP